jgi:hypothetical protein
MGERGVLEGLDTSGDDDRGRDLDSSPLLVEIACWSLENVM